MAAIEIPVPGQAGRTRAIMPVVILDPATGLPVAPTGGGGGGGGTITDFETLIVLDANDVAGVRREIIDSTGTPVISFETMSGAAWVPAQPVRPFGVRTVDANIASLPLPAGASTEATLAALSGKVPPPAGGRMPVDGSGVTQPVSAATLPLPTGASTEATLAALAGKVPAQASGRMPVDGSGVTQPVSAQALPLPAGAATEATLAAVSNKLPVQAGGRMPVDGSGVTQPVSAAALPLPAGAATDATVEAVRLALVGGLAVTITSADQPQLLASTLVVVSNEGTVGSGAEMASFENRGAADATVAGGVLPPGGVVTFQRSLGRLASIPYNATGTVLAIAKVG